MNKYALMMFLSFLIICLTLVAASLEISTTTDIAVNIPTDVSLSFSGVTSLITVFFRILTFRLVGVPTVINLFLFLPISIGVVYIIIDIIRGN